MSIFYPPIWTIIYEYENRHPRSWANSSAIGLKWLLTHRIIRNKPRQAWFNSETKPGKYNGYYLSVGFINACKDNNRNMVELLLDIQPKTAQLSIGDIQIGIITALIKKYTDLARYILSKRPMRFDNMLSNMYCNSNRPLYVHIKTNLYISELMIETGVDMGEWWNKWRSFVGVVWDTHDTTDCTVMSNYIFIIKGIISILPVDVISIIARY